ncbi:MAG TPA: MBL fold metallo-hydrolase [Bosea sp. (in: a-proteobacteria)]|jgi:glyoxylase-like metal-dependent hydrolase (beta-lactamase superfamily II)|uniref:MBL fold metallo-hydrolase n=1 Tax=Bosea sp. (in: a-proteobacteria) TaxID=1871050 RepID=UPI002DDD7B66|nr:MBL fold metallo-hydrolase [Bosea sp. (in: a-proteobacteria)]HEV2553572.1 MBL fold metallo-hydrolase [Bosea sp. (in: a-proteobacteria)]
METPVTDQPQTPLQIAVIPVTPFQQNCSILWCTKTMQAVIVDPGGDVALIRGALKEVGVTPVAIWLTHGHLDHAGGAAELAEALSVPVIGPHEADKFLLDELPTAGLRFDIRDMRAVTPSRWLAEGDEVKVGDVAFSVLHVPGHTPGHITFFQKDLRFLLAGDTVFTGSVGRTDFPYGSHETLIAGIRDKLLPLGDDVQFLPGHGPAGTLGEERANNPFLRG